MSKPKFSINERVMVRGHASVSISGKSVYIDDCLITDCRVYPVGEHVIIRNGIEYNNDIVTIYYRVDQGCTGWIEQPFIFPYQEPGSSFKEQMQELDRPIKQLEPV